MEIQAYEQEKLARAGMNRNSILNDTKENPAYLEYLNIKGYKHLKKERGSSEVLINTNNDQRFLRNHSNSFKPILPLNSKPWFESLGTPVFNKALKLKGFNKKVKKFKRRKNHQEITNLMIKLPIAIQINDFSGTLNRQDSPDGSQSSEFLEQNKTCENKVQRNHNIDLNCYAGNESNGKDSKSSFRTSKSVPAFKSK